MQRAGWIVALAGCGRLDFAPLQAPLDIDAPVGPSSLVQMLGPGFANAPSITIPVTHDTNSMLVVGVYWNVSSLTITVSDSQNLTWQALPMQAAPCADRCGESVEALWYASAPVAGTTTVVVTQSASSTCPLGAFLLDYHGLAANVLDSEGAIATVASTTAATPPITVPRTASIVAMYTDGISTGTFVPGSGFTTAVVDSGWYSMIATADNVGPGEYTPTAALPAGHNDACWSATAAVFALGP